MSVFDWYLIGINIIGFLLFALNTVLMRKTADKDVDLLLTITCVLGGSIGILLSLLLFDRDAEKENMMSRVFLFAVLGIQIVAFLIIKGYVRNDWTKTLFQFNESHKVLLIYLIVINVVTFIVYGVDKYKAVHRRWRIKIVTLLMLAFFGGSIGALCAMYGFNHKVNKDYFTVGVPLILVMQIVALVYFLFLR